MYIGVRYSLQRENWLWIYDRELLIRNKNIIIN